MVAKAVTKSHIVTVGNVIDDDLIEEAISCVHFNPAKAFSEYTRKAESKYKTTKDSQSTLNHQINEISNL